MTHPAGPTWDRLCAIATLGIQRAPMSAAAWPDAALANPDDSGERGLLRAAAATLLWRLAGQRATVQEALQAPAFPGVGGVEVSEAAAIRLARMLGDEDPDLIREWLSIARSTGKRLPPHWLPAVLDTLPVDLCREYATVLGDAATWLAAQNSRWELRVLPPEKQAAAEPNDERWLYGAQSERRAELQALRSRDPARAREWLEATWANDPPKAREAFLSVMLEGLSEQDEPFLETALNDKRKGVRLAAAECLARLPQSAYVARFIARLDPLLEFSAGLGLRVQLPANLDKAAQRDGVEAKAPAQRKIGERAFWLSQLITRVPPSHFSRRFACAAAPFVEAALASEYAAELLPGLSAAALRHPEPDWIAALSTGCRRLDQPAELRAEAIAELIAVAAPNTRPGLIEEQTRALFAENFSAGFALLSRIDEPWTPATTQLALRSLAAVARSDLQHGSRPRHTLERWARCCDLESALSVGAQLLEICPADSAWLRALEYLHEIIEYRAAMRQELLV